MSPLQCSTRRTKRKQSSPTRARSRTAFQGGGTCPLAPRSSVSRGIMTRAPDKHVRRLTPPSSLPVPEQVCIRRPISAPHEHSPMQRVTSHHLLQQVLSTPIQQCEKGPRHVQRKHTQEKRQRKRLEDRVVCTGGGWAGVPVTLAPLARRHRRATPPHAGAEAIAQTPLHRGLVPVAFRKGRS